MSIDILLSYKDVKKAIECLNELTEKLENIRHLFMLLL